MTPGLPAPSTGPSPDDLFLRLQTALAGEYSIERELGRGGMGVVYLAREVRLAREVAIKVLPPERAATPGLREQFLREAQMAARLSHPHIVPIHRVDETAGFVYFVMAYVAGQTLAERVRERGPLAPHQAARVLREVAWALTYAHASGIVHRDVKADNILLEQGSERALVTDFGIAGATHADARASDGQIAGSPHYASPEQITGQPVDAASDLYSLGVAGFLALTGRLPFDAPTSREVVAMHLNTRPPSITSLAPTVPQQLAQIVDRCLAKRPEHRFAGPAAFAEALEQAVAPPREIPPPVRVWLKNTNQFQRVEIIGGLYLAFGVGVPFAIATHAPLLIAPVLVAVIAGIGMLPWLVRTRRVLNAGYGLDDLRTAVREHWVRRREEEMYEVAAHSRSVSRKVVAVIFVASSLGAIALTVLSKAAFYGVGVPLAAVMAGTLAVGSGLLALIDRFRQRRTPKLGSSQIKFYDGKWGKRLVHLAGLGLKHRPTVSSLPQLTEVALGRATDALYDALPKPLRKQLNALPATVRRLEDDASTLRAEIDKLDASIGTLDGDARGALPSAITSSAHEERVRSERDRLRADLRVTRQRASDRLSATVAALENIRLNLLRLQLGDGRVESVTESLEAAQQVAADLGAFVDASVEVEASLAPRRTGAPIATP
jgi:eukaryotic-like serine/threonine-protein kinase